ncbi:HEPN domain-containing protein [Bacillus velezensis]|uniref:ApeA N-terminal domain 1-containing protein n=1 Tax=Bacillus velezensis TaxID=492670 RepID=UPI00224080AC|nr:HEPN domain-containing protein [Bacillus velezensis]
MDKIFERSRIESFQVMGEWWEKDKPEKVFTGTLSYSPEKITLELIGADTGLFSFEDIKTPKEMYGVSVSGESFKINIFGRDGSTYSVPGIPIVVYGVQSFIVGAYTDKHPEKYDSVIYSCDYLTSWISKGVFNEEIIPEKNFRKLEYELPESEIFRVPFINAIIKEYHWGKVKSSEISSYEKSIRHISGFQIKPDEKRGFEWFMKTIRYFKSFLSILVDYKTSNEQIILTAFNEKMNRSIEYKYFEKVKEVGRTLRKKIDPLFEYEDIKSKFGDILNRWFEKEEDLKTIVSLHLNKFESYYIESKFLTSIQALEIFHRRFYEGNILDQQIYNQASDKIKVFISEQLEGEVRDFFLAKFKHGNEYNLGKRLKELINDLSQDSKLYIIGNSERRTSFLQKLIETRNYLTHYDDSGKTTILKHPYVLFLAVIRMNIILVYVLLKELGINEELILRKINEHSRTDVLIDEARKAFG